MKKNSKIKMIFLGVMPIFLFIIGFTLAYYYTSDIINNNFDTTYYGATIEKNCNPPYEWWPGEEYTCEISGRNESDIDVALRITVYQSWRDEYYYNAQASNRFIYNVYDEEEDDYYPVEEDRAIINYINSNDWIDGGSTDYSNYSEHIFYYKYKLSKGESTSLLTDKITYNTNSLKQNCYDSYYDYDSETYSAEYCDENDGFFGQYSSQFLLETVQYDAYQEVWDTDVVIN